MPQKKKKVLWGGKREGSGRHEVADKKIKIWFSVRASQAESAKAAIRPIIEKLDKQYERRAGD